MRMKPPARCCVRMEGMPIRLLDVNSPETIREPEIPQEDLEKYIPAETGAAYFNKLFCLEREFRELPPKERQKKRMEHLMPWSDFKE